MEGDVVELEGEARGRLDPIEIPGAARPGVLGARGVVVGVGAPRRVGVSHLVVGPLAVDVRPEVGLTGAPRLLRVTRVAELVVRAAQFQGRDVLGDRRSGDVHLAEAEDLGEERRHLVVDGHLELVGLAGNAGRKHLHIGEGVVVSVAKGNVDGGAVGRAWLAGQPDDATQGRGIRSPLDPARVEIEPGEVGAEGGHAHQHDERRCDQRQSCAAVLAVFDAMEETFHCAPLVSGSICITAVSSQSTVGKGKIPVTLV